MTSHKSSVSTFLFTLKTTLANNFIWPLCGLGAIILALPLQVFLSLNTNPIYPQGTENLQEKYTFLLNPEPYFFPILIHIGIVFVSVVLAISIFRFITSKKTVNVYYSLGITRINLYLAKYLAGVILLFLMIAIPFLMSLIMNLNVLGSSPQLWSAFLFQLLGHFALSLFCFSVTAAIFSCVGTIFEGAAFSLVVLTLPNIVLTSLGFFMDKLVWGSAYGLYFGDKYGQIGLAEGASSFIPFKFFLEPSRIYSALSKDGKENPLVSQFNYFGENTESINWVEPNFYLVICWIVASLLVGLLGMYLYHKRKAEICGFLGKNKFLNFIVTFTIAFFAMSLFVNIFSTISIYPIFILSLILYTLIYCIIDFALIRNFKEFGRGFVKLPIHLGITATIFLVFLTGLFGFSSRVPDIKDIESAAISPPTNTTLFSSSSYSATATFFLHGSNHEFALDGFNTKEDLEKIIHLHKKLIADRNVGSNQDSSIQARVQIVYNLKNGKSIRRYYDAVMPETYIEMLDINSTTLYKEKIVDALTGEISKNDEFTLTEKKTLYNSPTTVIAMITKNMDKVTPLELTQEQRKDLLKAMAQDITAQTSAQSLMPEKPAIGAIQFINHEISMYRYGGDHFEYVEAKPPVDDFENADNLEFFSSEFDLTGNMDKSTFTITEDMKATIEFLKDNGLFELFESKKHYIKAEIVNAHIDTNNYSNFNNSYISFLEPSTHFISNWYSKEYAKNEDIKHYTMSFDKSHEVTDADKLKVLENSAHLTYFNAKGGYYVRFTLEDDAGYAIKFIPLEAMPSDIVQAVEKLGDQSILTIDFGY